MNKSCSWFGAYSRAAPITNLSFFEKECRGKERVCAYGKVEVYCMSITVRLETTGLQKFCLLAGT